MRVIKLSPAAHACYDSLNAANRRMFGILVDRILGEWAEAQRDRLFGENCLDYKYTAGDVAEIGLTKVRHTYR